MLTLRRHDHCKKCGTPIPQNHSGVVNDGLRWALDAFTPVEYAGGFIFRYTLRVPRTFPGYCDACAEVKAQDILRDAFKKKDAAPEKPVTPDKKGARTRAKK